MLAGRCLVGFSLNGVDSVGLGFELVWLSWSLLGCIPWLFVGHLCGLVLWFGLGWFGLWFVCFVGGSFPHMFGGELCESSPAVTRLTVYRRLQVIVRDRFF